MFLEVMVQDRNVWSASRPVVARRGDDLGGHVVDYDLASVHF